MIIKATLAFATLLLIAACSTENSNETLVIPSNNTAQNRTPVNVDARETVRIGPVTWAIKNLDVSTYRNGDPIPQVQDKTQWRNRTTGAWCYYANTTANGTIYGKLYNGYAVKDPRGLAPAGWHVPSAAELTSAVALLGEYPASKLKSQTMWPQGYNGNNQSGFTALPAGYRNIQFDNSDFTLIGEDAIFWLSDGGGGMGKSYHLTYAFPFLDTNDSDCTYGFSVRCVKN